MAGKSVHYPYEPNPENPRNPGESGGPDNNPVSDSDGGTPYFGSGDRDPDQAGGHFMESGADTAF